MLTILVVLTCLAGFLGLYLWHVYNANKTAKEFEEFLENHYRRGENGKYGPPIT